LGLFWLCTLDFGPKLALIGFELGLNWLCFFAPPAGKILVFTCQKRAYVNLVISKIGFVLHKKVQAEIQYN